MVMRRVQIMLEPELDDWVEREALHRGVSKGAVVRACLRERFRPLPPLADDALAEIVGMFEGRADDSQSVDRVVYGLDR